MNKNTERSVKGELFMLLNKKVVLAYSGSLNTSIAVQLLREEGYDVIAVCIDMGEGKDLSDIKVKAIQVGAVSSYVVYAKDEFINDYEQLAPQKQFYGKDSESLVSALSRPFITKKLVEIAEQENAVAIAHGCNSIENDQVYFEDLVKELNSNLVVLAPAREWNWSREEKIAYAKENSIPIPSNVQTDWAELVETWF